MKIIDWRFTGGRSEKGRGDTKLRPGVEAKVYNHGWCEFDADLQGIMVNGRVYALSDFDKFYAMGMDQHTDGDGVLNA